MVGAESEQSARSSKSSTVAVAQGIDAPIDTLKIGQEAVANAPTTCEREHRFRGTNASGSVVDLTVGTVMGVHGSLEQALSGRQAIQLDIALHTNYRIFCKTSGRIHGQTCIRCYCVLNRGVVDSTVRNRSPKTSTQHPRKVTSSSSASKRKRSRRPKAHRLPNKCKALLVVALEHKYCKYRWVVFRESSTHTHVAVPKKEKMTPQQEIDCCNILGANPTTASRRTCMRYLLNNGYTRWKTIDNIWNLTKALKTKGLKFPATAADD